MKEIPMLFSTPMVQAGKEGRKTKTRRTKGLEHINESPDDWQFEWAEPMRNIWTFTQKSSLNEQSLRDRSFNQFQTKCPYGQPGDLLWVRETWAPDLAGHDVNDYIEFIRYVADGTRLPIKWVKDYSAYRNRPGIHMNKEYARIWLQATEVRVERLQDISEEDAIAEGVEKINESVFPWKHYASGSASCSDAITSFKTLWEELNGLESWQSNPFVWVVTFTVLSTTGKPDLNNQ